MTCNREQRTPAPLAQSAAGRVLGARAHGRVLVRTPLALTSPRPCRSSFSLSDLLAAFLPDPRAVGGTLGDPERIISSGKSEETGSAEKGSGGG